MTLPNRWISQLGLLAAWLAAALLLGWWFGGVSWWLVGALALYIVHTLRNVYLLDDVLNGGTRVPLFETKRVVGGDFRTRRQDSNQSAQSEAQVPQAAARGAGKHRRPAGRRDHSRRRRGDSVVQPRCDAPAGPRSCDRHWPSHRQLAAPPRFRRVPREPYGRRHLRPLAAARIGLASRADHPVRQGSAACDRARHYSRDEARAHAPRFRGERFPRAALAADRDQWVPRHARRRRRAAGELESPDRRDATSGRTDDADPPRPDRAHAPRVRGDEGRSGFRRRRQHAEADREGVSIGRVSAGSRS